MNKIDNDAHTAVVGPRHEEIEQHGADERLSGHDIVVNLLTCEPARTSILFVAAMAFFLSAAFLRGTLSSGATYSLTFVAPKARYSKSSLGQTPQDTWKNER